MVRRGGGTAQNSDRGQRPADYLEAAAARAGFARCVRGLSV